MFQREDWNLFCTLDTLGQKAGVPQRLLPRLVAKELADNALDSGAKVEVDVVDGVLVVEDDGDGIPGTDEEIARLFSIARPLTSSKLLRLPTRGALGNGLRVVAGAVLASRGRLWVHTAGRSLELCPQDDGHTAARVIGAYNGQGTRIEVELGPPITLDDDAVVWAHGAIQLAKGGKNYKGKTSAYWYDEETFWELLQAAKAYSVRDLVTSFEGFSGSKAGKIAKPYLGRRPDELTREEAANLLAVMPVGECSR
jgi:hypothetical protein